MSRLSELRDQAIFTYWLEKRVLKRRGLTACAFKRICDEGKVPGFEPGAFSVPVNDPDSDTVSGSPDGEEQREETDADSCTGSGSTQPVRSYGVPSENYLAKNGHGGGSKHR